MFFGGVIKDGFDLHIFVHPGCRPTHSFNGECAADKIPAQTPQFQKRGLNMVLLDNSVFKGREGSGGSNKGRDNSRLITESLSGLSELQ